MRKRDGYRKIEIIETDSEYSNTSKCHINRCTNFCLILIIIMLYMIIVFINKGFLYLFRYEKSISGPCEKKV